MTKLPFGWIETQWAKDYGDGSKWAMVEPNETGFTWSLDCFFGGLPELYNGEEVTLAEAIAAAEAAAREAGW